MSIITKFLLFIFLKFITFNLYSIDAPKNLIVQVIKKSEKQEGARSKNSDLILVNYSGWIFDSNISTDNYCSAKGEMFDSNIIEKFNHVIPFQFVLGKGIVIKGWDLGLQDMGINEQRCLVIPSHLAYGNRSIGNIIKPNSTLIFEVKLLNILEVK